MITLKNCPYCQPPTMVDVIRVITLDDKLAYAVMCNECQARSPMVYLESDSSTRGFTSAREAAIIAWNEMSEAVAHRKAVDACGDRTAIECVVSLEKGGLDDGVYSIYLTGIHGTIDINDISGGKSVQIEHIREAIAEKLGELKKSSLIADVVLVEKSEQEDVFFNSWFEIVSFNERGGEDG